ncbi:alpha-mannosidase [Lederbergia lenta]|uniref:alpha-mannosidase n=1 Tax=Lederbergia lenta TaxID=1467 RepID=A0A2X4W4C4_LEDLE|nr:alpha-mannosidase [Lederbergia lenta]MEC2325760.1 alpha-mannosidase [Lederbergia lenta]SQI53792.1 alpha-mannosidase [Lederbergia lenta]
MRRINRFIQYLSGHQRLETLNISSWAARRAQYKEPSKYIYEESESEMIHVGDQLITTGVTMFLEQSVTVPAEWDDYPVGVEFRVGQPEVSTHHEGLLSIDGVPYHGIDRNRSYIPFPKNRNGKYAYDLKIELFNPAAQPLDTLNHQNEPAEYNPAPLILLQSDLICVNAAVESLLYTVKVYFETARTMSVGDLKQSIIVKALKETSELVLNESEQKLKDQAWVKSIETRLLNKLAELNGYSHGKIHMVGQSHIDLAWLWPLKEAVRKCSRTFSTMSTLLDQFPAFGYAQSQPQAYAFIKEHYPDIYERVKAHIASGKWEVVGGMWVEPDLNIPSGESLVRQLVYGMKFYQEEFGVKPRIEWLPDTFGYCASLPQLLRKAGIDYFMTTKMNWNDTNAFPYDLFNWIGIDGTSVISYVNHGVNEYTHPKEIQDHWDSYKQKSVHPEQMLLYGHGDGGGGVTKEMLEYVERSDDLPGLPSCVYSTAHEFFDGVQKADPTLPTWQGDMYLELHRGTYTTHARNKRWNRKAEVLYRDAEIWSSFASLYGASGNTRNMEAGWKLLLLNQFHDIIPGTSIPDVYVKSESDYQEIFKIGSGEKENVLHSLESQINTAGDGVPVLLFNSLSWERSETIIIKGGPELLEVRAYDEDGTLLTSDIQRLEEEELELSVYIPSIPEMGYCTIWLKADHVKKEIETNEFNGHWETDFYQVEWNASGEISRLYDKKAKREVVKSGETANQLQLFHDRPLYWDAWDIDSKFAEQQADQVKLLSVSVIQKGKTKDILRFKWSISQSMLEQDIVFYHHTRRIDFETKVEWKEAHKLLKVAFPVDVLTNRAAFEIPFGTVERATHTNTSWEQAQFEVCGHRFADLSETNYGVSLLNDCKYGYDVKDNVLRLSLLRAPKWPDPGADQGFHEFTYSIYPHEGNWQEANIVRRGYELNHPISVLTTTNHEGVLPSQHSFVKIRGKHGVLDTVKPSEDKRGLVLRFYESGGGREQINMQIAGSLNSAEETNLLEEHISTLAVEDGELVIDLQPFEVKTIRLNND